MNPLTQFKETRILPVLIALALVVVGALIGVPALATPPVVVTTEIIGVGSFHEIDASAKTDIDPGPGTHFWKASTDVRTLAIDPGNPSTLHAGTSGGVGESASESGELGAWSAPINAGAPLNTEYNDMYAILTADGLTVYFTSDRPGGLGKDDLWVSRRENIDAPWGQPGNLAILNTEFNDSLSVFNTSGNIMYFHSDRPGGGCGAGDLWTSRAEPGGDGWTAPVNMGCVVNTGSIEIAPAFYANDDLGRSTIYFGSDRPGGIGGFDIYETTTTYEDLESAVWGPGVLVPELSSPARDTRTFVRRDGREIFITTDRTGSLGGLDIWVATREDSSHPWSTPVNPGAPLNSAAHDGSPALSRGGRTLYFFSTRQGGLGLRDIWFTERK